MYITFDFQPCCMLDSLNLLNSNLMIDSNNMDIEYELKH